MSAADIVGVPVPWEVLVRALGRHEKVRIQTLIEPMVRHQAQIDRTDELSVAVVDVETTGLDWQTDRIIELAIQKVFIDAHGRIVATGRPEGWFEDPGFPIPLHIQEKTHITDRMVKGKLILEGPATSMLLTADVILSHNAGFDRPFLEKRLDIAGRPWICSLRDLDWNAHGFERHGLEDLLRKCGKFFNSAHRATADVNALLHLLDHRLDNGRTVLKELLTNAAKPTWLVEARGAPYGSRKLLKERRYVWDPEQKLWWRHIPEEGLEAERAWLSDWVYDGKREPVVRHVTWRERYAAS